MQTIVSIVAAIATLTIGPTVSAQTAQRSIVPIREVDIRPFAVPRYAIEIAVNGVSMLAGLDTGSTGLRLLPRAAARARVAPGGAPETYDYGSGVMLEGHRGQASVAIGQVRDQVVLQAVDHVGCTVQKPQCPAVRVSPTDYGLMGSGQPGQGFPAIIGVQLEQGRVENPLPLMGVHRWIIHLPPRGRGPGALILNPDARDTAGFIALRPGAANARGTVAGCVGLALPGAEQLCGPTLFDTGAPGLNVVNAQRPPAWQPNRPAALRLIPADAGPRPAAAFTTGNKAYGANATFSPGQGAMTIIHAGTLPFYAFDVLFDADTKTIAVRPNATAGSVVSPRLR